MEYLKRIQPVQASIERFGEIKELLGPKVTMYLVQDPTYGGVWVEELKQDSVVLAKGLATFDSLDKKIGFLTIRVGKKASSSIIIHLHREYGPTILKYGKAVSEHYKPFEELWFTASMLPVALIYGKSWKRLG